MKCAIGHCKSPEMCQMIRECDARWSFKYDAGMYRKDIYKHTEKLLNEPCVRVSGSGDPARFGT